MIKKSHVVKINKTFQVNSKSQYDPKDSLDIRKVSLDENMRVNEL